MAPPALNFDTQATIDDGSCRYDYIGCTDSAFYNYQSDSTTDDGSCILTPTFGCMDPSAANFDALAVVDDGSCSYYVMPPHSCADSLSDNYRSDIDGIQFLELPGSCKYTIS